VLQGPDGTLAEHSTGRADGHDATSRSHERRPTPCRPFFSSLLNLYATRSLPALRENRPVHDGQVFTAAGGATGNGAFMRRDVGQGKPAEAFVRQVHAWSSGRGRSTNRLAAEGDIAFGWQRP
jgi:hypothetical protein